MPALLISMSIFPNFSCTIDAALETLLGSVTSSWMGKNVGVLRLADLAAASMSVASWERGERAPTAMWVAPARA